MMNNRLTTAIALLNAMLAKSDVKDGSYEVRYNGDAFVVLEIHGKRILSIAKVEGEGFQPVYGDNHERLEAAG